MVRKQLRRRVGHGRRFATRGGGSFVNADIGITGFLPASVAQGSGIVDPLQILGFGFTPSTEVWFAGALVPSAYSSSTVLTITVAAATVLVPGFYNVFVVDPTYPATSNSRTWGVEFPFPTFTNLSPAFIYVREGTATPTVTGSGFFTSGTTALVDGEIRPFAYASSTSGTLTLAPALVHEARSMSVVMRNPEPGGGTTAPLAFDVRYRAPTNTALSATSVELDSGDVTIRITGTNFYDPALYAGGGTIGQVDTVDVPTTYVDATHVDIVVPASATSVAGTKQLRVRNPTEGNGGGFSASRPLLVGYPVPVLGAISPAKINYNAGPTTITLSGSEFTPASLARVGGVVQTTDTSGAPSAISFVFTPSTPAELVIDATNPTTGGGGGPSVASKSLAVVPIISTMAPNEGIQYDPPTVTSTIGGAPFTATTVVEINGIDCPTTLVDPTTVTITIPGTVSIAPGALLVRVKRAPGAPTSLDALGYFVVAYDPLVTATGNYASYDADHVTLDAPTNPNPNDVIQLNDIVGGVGAYFNGANVTLNPPLIASDATLNNYATIDFNGVNEYLGLTVGTNPLLSAQIPAGDFTIAAVFNADSVNSDDTAGPYNNQHIWGSDQFPGVRCGLYVRQNGGTGAAGTTGKVGIWVWDSPGVAKKVEADFVIGNWTYVIVKKVGTTLSINVNGGAFVNLAGVGNIFNVTTQRTQVGRSWTTAGKYLDGRFRALIFGHWVGNDMARFYNYCVFRLGIV